MRTGVRWIRVRNANQLPPRYLPGSLRPLKTRVPKDYQGVFHRFPGVLPL